jgi:hypothetical protein
MAIASSVCRCDRELTIGARRNSPYVVEMRRQSDHFARRCALRRTWNERDLVALLFSFFSTPVSSRRLCRNWEKYQIDSYPFCVIARKSGQSSNHERGRGTMAMLHRCAAAYWIVRFRGR